MDQEWYGADRSERLGGDDVRAVICANARVSRGGAIEMNRDSDSEYNEQVMEVLGDLFVT